MTEIRLSRRLKALSSMVEPCDTFTDIGCDHALLPLWLIQQGICKRALASDVNPGPLESAKKNAESFGTGEDRISFILSDGLDSLTPPKDGKNTLCIAGMGGLLIEEILQRGRDKTGAYSSFMLSPHTKQYELRRYLTENGFTISDERYVCEDDKLYVMISACHAPSLRPLSYSETELRFGRYIKKALEDRDVAGHITARYEELLRLIQDKEGLPEERRKALSEEALCCREVLGI
ncbi:MAG: SAM-dependent methyltransferase [Lachnospiraceae bacterium]|nr:SAM-dependent methyltransferase [Lachnospiraceae bacterium]